MRLRAWAIGVALSTCASSGAGGCIELNAPSELGAIFAGPHIIGGVLRLDQDMPACSYFEGDLGVAYVLIQGPRLTNEEFDSLFIDGASLRLEVQERFDITTTCGAPVAEVLDVLEVVP